MKVCGKRHGGAIGYCELPAGHDRKPREEAPREAPGRSRRGAGLRRRKPLRQRSDRQAALEARWARLKAKRMREQRRVYGHTFCERCGRRTDRLHFHHKRHRSLGGSWDDANGELVCCGPGSCHEAEHGIPWPDRSDD